MEIVIGIIIGLAIGFFVGKLMEAKSAGEDKTQLVAKAQVLAANIEQIKLHHASEVQSMKSQMENERLYAAKLRAESDQQWAQKLESLKQEMQRMTIEQQKVAAEQLAAKQSALQETNRLQIDELLKPAEHLRGNDETLPAGTAAGCTEPEGADREDWLRCCQPDQGIEGRQQDAGRLGRDGAGNHPGEQRTS